MVKRYYIIVYRICNDTNWKFFYTNYQFTTYKEVYKKVNELNSAFSELAFYIKHIKEINGSDSN